MYNELKGPEIKSDLQLITLARQSAATKIGKVIKRTFSQKRHT